MQVTIVAKIQSVKDASSGAMMKMVVYDGTGSFNVEHYMPQDDEQVPTLWACQHACLQTRTDTDVYACLKVGLLK